MSKKTLAVCLIISLLLNALLIAFVISEQKYKDIQYLDYKLKYAHCDGDSMTTDSEVYEAWKANKPLCNF